jgi:hypothetical protein
VHHLLGVKVLINIHSNGGMGDRLASEKGHALLKQHILLGVGEGFVLRMSASCERDGEASSYQVPAAGEGADGNIDWGGHVVGLA